MEAGLAAEDLVTNARVGVTGEVLGVEKPSNNDKGDVENTCFWTFQVLAELKKQQREPPFKAPQMDAPVQYTVLAEIPATNPADAHSTKKFGLQHQPLSTAPLSRLRSHSPVTSCSLHQLPHRFRPPADTIFDDLYDRDSVIGSPDGFARRLLRRMWIYLSASTSDSPPPPPPPPPPAGGGGGGWGGGRRGGAPAAVPKFVTICQIRMVFVR
jgi:hypothetical protein